MSDDPNIRFEDWLEERMADPDFQAEWKASEPAYQVARLRIMRGLTQQQLAERVGTRQPDIARLESGQSEPTLSFLRRVVEALGGQLEVRIRIWPWRAPTEKRRPSWPLVDTSNQPDGQQE